MVAVRLTVLLSSFLLFLVQPVIAKQILPWFGGAAGVWSVCLLFFQSDLLCGYAYAHWLTQSAHRMRQRAIHLGLLGLSCLSLPIVALPHWQPAATGSPGLQVFGLLAATVGLPYFLLAASAPLLQKWLSANATGSASRTSIYRLFALSNLGSLVGLLAFPFAIEPFSTVREQALIWSAAYLVFAASFTAVAVRTARTARTTASMPGAGASSEGTRTAGTRPALSSFMYWISCAALGSALLLAVTNHVTQNVASIPFLWIVPLTIYLLSFVVCFDGRSGQGWYTRRYWLVPMQLVTGAMAWALFTREGVLSIYITLPLFALGLFLGCVCCHGELARSKPQPEYLTQFYLSLAAGGATGGLFVAGIAPHIFNGFWETPLALAGEATLALCAGWRQPTRTRGALSWLRALTGIIVAASIVALAGGWPGHGNAGLLEKIDDLGWPSRAALLVVFVAALALSQKTRLRGALGLTTLLCTAIFGLDYYHLMSADAQLMLRSFYGTLRVSLTDPGPDQVRRLMHGVILHGSEFTDAARSALPTTYYGPRSGIGLTLTSGRPATGALQVGSIGLGTGTLTAYGQTGDRYRIYELNPQVVAVAETRFNYLSESHARVETILGDARLSLERGLALGDFDDPKNRFDVLSIDAFSSDAIPVHLLTREAFAVYARTLKDNGVIAFHTSNRYLDLPPVVEELARHAGFLAFLVIDHSHDPSYSTTDWVLVTRNREFLARPAIASAGSLVAARAGLRPWTDQFNDLFEILK